MSTVVLLGNNNPQMQIPVHGEDAEGQRVVVGNKSIDAPHLKQSETSVSMWDGFDDPDFVQLSLSTDNDRMLSLIARSLPEEDQIYAVGINELEQIWSVHSPSAKPAWVDCDDAQFARVISEHFDCPVGRPTMLLTNAGRDALHKQHLDTAAQPASLNFIALTANATAPSTASTTLTAEIATAGGGLIRAQATFAHTGGTNTSTLTKTFTANGSDSLPVTIAKMGTFNASTVGTMGYETLLSATATLSAIGDNVAITWTLTAG